MRALSCGASGASGAQAQGRAPQRGQGVDGDMAQAAAPSPAGSFVEGGWVGGPERRTARGRPGLLACDESSRVVQQSSLIDELEHRAPKLGVPGGKVK